MSILSDLFIKIKMSQLEIIHLSNNLITDNGI